MASTTFIDKDLLIETSSLRISFFQMNICLSLLILGLQPPSKVNQAMGFSKQSSALKAIWPPKFSRKDMKEKVLTFLLLELSSLLCTAGFLLLRKQYLMILFLS